MPMSANVSPPSTPEITMADVAGLLKLAERCEAVTGPDRELDAFIEVALGAWPNTLEADKSIFDEDSWSVVEREPDGRKVDRYAPQSYTTSLDAAMTLADDFVLLHLSHLGADGLPLCRLGDPSTTP